MSNKGASVLKESSKCSRVEGWGRRPSESDGGGRKARWRGTLQLRSGDGWGWGRGEKGPSTELRKDPHVPGQKGERDVAGEPGHRACQDSQDAACFGVTRSRGLTVPGKSLDDAASF